MAVAREENPRKSWRIWCEILGRLETYIYESYLNAFHPHGGGAPGAS